ncbi:MAG: restriction endonuclease subunit S [Methanobacterium sp. ERen5]|nr:MAG: restriction endonuclease subunit S [Methanobacterium sp. ERen5]
MVKDASEIKWGTFVLSEVFTIESTSSGIDKNKLINKKGMIPYITRTDENNGIANLIGKQDEKYFKNKGNVITIGLDTQTVFYQAKEFYTGQNIQILYNKKLNNVNALFLIPLLEKIIEKFSWGGYGATLTRLRKSRVMLPINSDKEPDWDFMESYIKKKETYSLMKLKSYLDEKLSVMQDKAYLYSDDFFDMMKWGEFLIENLFNVNRGRRLIKKDRKNGKIAFYSATEYNNGVTDFISNPLFVEKNKILVTIFGDAFFAEEDFTASDDVTILGNNKLNKYNGLFVCEMIKNNKEKFKFGYKCFSERIKRQTILLPINEENNEPDWDFMESYIRKIKYEKLNEYSNYIEERLNN